MLGGLTQKPSIVWWVEDLREDIALARKRGDDEHAERMLDKLEERIARARRGDETLG